MLKKTLKISLLILSSFFVLLTTVGASTHIGNSTNMFGLTEAGKHAEIDASTLTISKSTPMKVVSNVIQIALSLLAIIFFIVVLYAGVKWMVAFGNTENSEKAKSTLEAALIGLGIILASYAITRFIFSGLGLTT